MNNLLLDDYNELGVSIDVDGDRMVIGAAHQQWVDVPGKAFIYERVANSWQMVDADPNTPGVQYLQASDGVDFDAFGDDVALSGDYLAVSAVGADTSVGVNRGAVYVYERQSDGTWLQVVKLDSPFNDEIAGSPPGQFDLYGWAVAIEGTMLAVSETWPGGGWIHTYERIGSVWTYQESLQPAIVGNNDLFGGALAIDGTRMAATALGYPSGADHGAVFVYNYNAGSWGSETFVDTGGGNDHYFGTSVALEGDRLIVGAPQVDDDDTNGVGAGYARVYDFSGSWTLTATLSEAANPQNKDGFGRSVVIENGVIAVGAFLIVPLDRQLWSHLCISVKWPRCFVQTHLFTASDAQTDDSLGRACAMHSSQEIMAGAYLANGTSTEQGEVYLFTY
ncbi:MAG: hypothetical protein IPJ88_11705 [Myxococcales bacterium]|nr:MAG: hypothetical protein IPJ88_11705 [Myxococcales bacterium]